MLEAKSVAKAEVVRKYGGSLQTFLRWNGAGYRSYNSTLPRLPKRHKDLVLLWLFPILPLDVSLNYEGCRLTPNRRGQMYAELLKEAAPRGWDAVISEESETLYEGEAWLIEYFALPNVVRAYVQHHAWYAEKAV